MIDFFPTPGVHSQKVRIMLEETGLPYAPRAADAGAVEPTFFGRSPSLRDPDGPGGLPITISESAAIALYLARKARKFGPEGAREAVAFDYWSHAISSTLSSLFAVHEHFKAQADAATTAIFADAVRKALHGFEDNMATRHFMIGERFTVIDALLYPHLATSAPALNGGLSGFPNLERYRDRIAQREAVRRAMSAI